MLGTIRTVAIWGAVIAASILIAVNSAPYFAGVASHPFLAERPELTSGKLWRSVLLTHVSGGVLCLLSGPILIWNLALRKSRALHRYLGWGYTIAVLGCSAPTGLYLSFFAKGGFWASTGFLVTDVFWIGTTALGLTAIRQRRVAVHAAWMARSYAITVSAVFFRFIFVGLHVLGVSGLTNYIASIWLSLVMSLLVGESFVAQLRSLKRIRALSFSMGTTS